MSAPRSRIERRYLSPLRYPGGKARLSRYLADTFAAQWGLMDVEVWVEPFAGGLGAGLALLDRAEVSEVWFAEKNPALAAMWRTVIADPEAFATRVEQISPTLSTFRDATAAVEAVYEGDPVDDLTAGLAAFLVNRCSRSGIVAPRVGPIGGQAQSGKWTVESRFDGPRLADRVRHIASLTPSMRFLGADAIACIDSLDGSGVEEEVMLFVDPPYVREGNRLYAEGMTRGAHRDLAAALNHTPARWVLTYDTDPFVVDVLYPDRRVIEFDIAHTANQQRIAREYLLFSPNAVAPDPHMAPVMARGDARWVRSEDRTWPTLIDDNLREGRDAVGGPPYCQDELTGFAAEGALT